MAIPAQEASTVMASLPRRTAAGTADDDEDEVEEDDDFFNDDVEMEEPELKAPPVPLCPVPVELFLAGMGSRKVDKFPMDFARSRYGLPWSCALTSCVHVQNAVSRCQHVGPSSFFAAAACCNGTFWSLTRVVVVLLLTAGTSQQR